MSPWAYNQDVLLNRVEDKQSFKRLSVYISIKCRKLQCIKKLFSPFNFLLQIAFLFDSSIHFICTLYFHTSTEYPFSFRGTSLWSSNSSFKATHPVVKKNKKIFCFILFSLIGFGVLMLRKNCFILVLRKIISRFYAHPDVGPLKYTPTKKDLSPDINLGPIFRILRYYPKAFKFIHSNHLILRTCKIQRRDFFN